MSVSCVQTIDNTHQERDISIVEKVRVVPCKRIVGCRFGVSRHSREARRLCFKCSGLGPRGFKGSLRNHGRVFLGGYSVGGNDGGSTRTW